MQRQKEVFVRALQTRSAIEDTYITAVFTSLLRRYPGLDNGWRLSNPRE